MKNLVFPALLALSVALGLTACDDEPPGGVDGAIDASATDGGRELDGGGPTDGGRADRPNPLPDSGRDGARRVGDSGRPGDGGFGCCDSGECARGYRCDWESCGCVEATGCCAGEPCETEEAFCDEYDCRCVAPDDCCYFGCGPGLVCDYDSCGTCTEDTSCGECPDGFFCSYGTCYAPCAWDEVCDDGLVCNPTVGCVPPACTAEECYLGHEPPWECDPASGCYDPCTFVFDPEPRPFGPPPIDGGGPGGFRCEDLGAGVTCQAGHCIDDSCSGVPEGGCGYQVDCCGNHQCLPAGVEPICPTECYPEAFPPGRDSDCACGYGGFCADLRPYADTGPIEVLDGGVPLPVPEG